MTSCTCYIMLYQFSCRGGSVCKVDYNVLHKDLQKCFSSAIVFIFSFLWTVGNFDRFCEMAWQRRLVRFCEIARQSRLEVVSSLYLMLHLMYSSRSHTLNRTTCKLNVCLHTWFMYANNYFLLNSWCWLLFSNENPVMTSFSCWQ